MSTHCDREHFCDQNNNEDKHVNGACEESDDDAVTLSADALRALQEFYSESQSPQKKVQVDENWRLSQFWYDKETSDTLAREVLTVAVKSLTDTHDRTTSFNIACLSCPTLYGTLNHHLYEERGHPQVAELEDDPVRERISIRVFEFDERFAMYGNDFVYYDYKSPLDVSKEYDQHFDMIVCDPPYLSEACQTKMAMTIRQIGKPTHKLIVSTGEVMGDFLTAVHKVHLTKFIPRHANKLANVFSCHANYTTLFLE